MGNFVSCKNVISVAMGSSSVKAARVILPGGEIRRLGEPVKAAEIMLEHPTHFLVNVGSLVKGRRFSALAADEDLEFGNAYVMFPMKRLSSMITAADVAVFLTAANSAAKRVCTARNVAKVLPEEGGDETSENDVSLWAGVVLDGFVGREYQHRSKKPLLETIIEEPSPTRVRL